MSVIARGKIIRRRKKSCLFPLTRPTLVFHADPKVFSAQFQKKILINPNFDIFFLFIAVLLAIHQDNGV